MLHVEDTSLPFHNHFDIRQVFEEFVDHVSLFYSLSSKNDFVMHYNEWAQKSNSHLRLLRETRRKWQEASSYYEAYAKLRTAAYILCCLIGLWAGAWRLSVLALTAHVLSECIRRVFYKRVWSTTYVKTPLKCIFLSVSKMKIFFSQIHMEMEGHYVSSKSTSGSRGFYVRDESSCRSENRAVSSHFFPFWNIFCAIMIFFVAYALYSWTTDDLYSYFLSLLATVACVTALSYFCLAYTFVKQFAAVQSQLTAESNNFINWFEDWITRNNINIYFCYYKLRFLNLMSFEGRKCLLDDSHCKFLTMWFLTSLQRNLDFALKKGHFRVVVTNLFSNISVDKDRFLDLQYIGDRMQTALKATNKSHKNLRHKIRTHNSVISNSKTSSQGEGTSVTVTPSCSVTPNTVNNCTICTGSSFCAFHPQTKNYSRSGSSIQSLNSFETISYCLTEDSNSEYFKNPCRNATPKVSPRKSSLNNKNLKTISRFKRKYSQSSESTVSSTQGSGPLKISASESSVSSKDGRNLNYNSVENSSKEPVGSQNLNYNSMKNRSKESVGLSFSNSHTDWFDQCANHSKSSGESFRPNSRAEDCLVTNVKQVHQLQNSPNTSFYVMPTEKRIESDSKMVSRQSCRMKSNSDEPKTGEPFWEDPLLQVKPSEKQSKSNSEKVPPQSSRVESNAVGPKTEEPLLEVTSPYAKPSEQRSKSNSETMSPQSSGAERNSAGAKNGEPLLEVSSCHVMPSEKNSKSNSETMSPQSCGKESNSDEPKSGVPFWEDSSERPPRSRPSNSSLQNHVESSSILSQESENLTFETAKPNENQSACYVTSIFSNPLNSDSSKTSSKHHNKNGNSPDVENRRSTALTSLSDCNFKSGDSGERSSGHDDSGERSSGNDDSGERSSGNDDSGERSSGNDDSGERSSGNDDSGERSSGKLHEAMNPKEKEPEYIYDDVKDCVTKVEKRFLPFSDSSDNKHKTAEFCSSQSEDKKYPVLLNGHLADNLSFEKENSADDSFLQTPFSPRHDNKLKIKEFCSSQSEDEKRPVLLNGHRADKLSSEKENSAEDSFLQTPFSPRRLQGTFSDADGECFRNFSSNSDSNVLFNWCRKSPKEMNSIDDYLHKPKSMDNFPFKNPAENALLSTHPTADISYTQKPVSEDDSDEMSFPMASTDDENFRFHPESGCTSDTAYSEQHDNFEGAWRSQDRDQTNPTYSKDSIKDTCETKDEASVGRSKGVFKFDNFDFKFDLNPASENMTVKFYCESEEEGNKSVSPIMKKRKFDIRKDEAYIFSYKASAPADSHMNSDSPDKRILYSELHEDKDSVEENVRSESHDIQSCTRKNESNSESDYCTTDYFFSRNDNATSSHRELKKTVKLNLDGINFNFKRRKNSGPLKIQYHRRQESKDFLFKSRFKRFRFRCGNGVPRPYEEQGEQEAYESNCEQRNSESDSNY